MKRKGRAKEFKIHMKENKKKAIVYFVLRALVIAVMIAEIFNREWNNVFFCILTLFLFTIPSVIDRKFNIELPNTLEIIVLLFIFAAEILGEIQEYYLLFEKWDDMLHTINGFLCAAIGFSLIDILNRNERFHFTLSPVFVAMVAFCFSMTIGVLWEFFEFSMDYLTFSDMQKDTVLATISSILFNPDGVNEAIKIPINSIVINDQTWNYGGYIDIGLYDTMHDLWVNFIGAVIFSIIGAFYIKNRGKDIFIQRFIPKLKKEKSTEINPSEDVKNKKIKK